MAKTAGIIQARTGSTRLPGKVLMEAGGKTMLGHLIERANRARSLDEVIVATSTNPENDAIEEECVKLGAGCFRTTSENDVLNRYLQAIRWITADTAVRITGDSILMDPQIIDYVTGQFHSGKYDCATNYSTKTFPTGFSLSVFTEESLGILNDMELSERDREHVILAYLNNKDRFKVLEVKAPDKWNAYPLSLALDTQDDFELITAIIRELSKVKADFGLDDILDYIKKHNISR